MFRGINTVTIDAKSRLSMPSRYRDALNSGSMVVTIDTEETCLLIYTLAAWLPIESKIQQLPSFNPAARRIQRLLIGHATDVELDGSGRILLPQYLREYAKLDKQAVLIGQGNKFELWSESVWAEKRDVWLGQELNPGDMPGNIDDIAL